MTKADNKAIKSNKNQIAPDECPFPSNDFFKVKKHKLFKLSLFHGECHIGTQQIKFKSFERKQRPNELKSIAVYSNQLELNLIEHLSNHRIVI